MSVLPSPRTGYTVRQHNQTCLPHHVNDSVSPGTSGPVGFGDSCYTARRRGEHSSVCQPTGNNKFCPYRSTGAKRTYNHEHDYSCYPLVTMVVTTVGELVVLHQTISGTMHQYQPPSWPFPLLQRLQLHQTFLLHPEGRIWPSGSNSLQCDTPKAEQDVLGSQGSSAG